MKTSETQLVQAEQDVTKLEAPISLTPEQLELVDLELVSGGLGSTFLGGLIGWFLRN